MYWLVESCECDNNEIEKSKIIKINVALNYVAG